MPSHAKRCREANGEPFVTRTPKEEKGHKERVARAADHQAAYEDDPNDGIRLYKLKGRAKGQDAK